MQPLAGGFCATLWGIMGDLDYFTKALLLPRSTQEKGPCSLRRCRGKGAFTWSDFRRQAPWRQVQWTAQAWRNWPDRSPSILFTLENFSPWLIAMDLMHVKYLGHDQQVYGSILTLLCSHILPGSAADNIKQIWKDIQAIYAEHNVPCRFRYLNRTSMYTRKAPQYPKLRGKAAEIKYLALPLYLIWQRYSKSNIFVHKQILLYLKLNLEAEELLAVHKGDLAFPPDAAKRFEQIIESMLLVLTAIAEHFLPDRLFNITQKAHFLQHISVLARFINPRLLWCFMGEDMQKRMSGLAKTCVNGLKPGQTSHKMLSRYRIALHLQFLSHE